MKAKACALKKLENKCFTRCSKSARVFASHRDSRDQTLFEFVPKHQHKLLYRFYRKNQLVAISFAWGNFPKTSLEWKRCMDGEEWQLLGHATQKQNMPDILVSHLFVVFAHISNSFWDAASESRIVSESEFFHVCELQSVIVNVYIHMNVDLVQVLILTYVNVYMEMDMYNFARDLFLVQKGAYLAYFCLNTSCQVGEREWVALVLMCGRVPFAS